MSSVEKITKAVMKEVADWDLDNIKTDKDLQEFIDEIHIKFGDYQDHQSLKQELDLVRNYLHKTEIKHKKELHDRLLDYSQENDILKADLYNMRNELEIMDAENRELKNIIADYENDDN